MNLNEDNNMLENMKQYFLDRNEFCEIVTSVISYDTLIDAFNYGEFNQGNYFAWFQDEGEFYILHKNSGMMVNWYKHLGRTNTCNQNFRTAEDIRIFFSLFKEDLEEWAEDRHIILD